MIKITTHYGEFEAETEREALKAARAAKRKAARQEKIDQKNREHARRRARSAGFRYFNRILSGDECPPGWRYYPAGYRNASSQIAYGATEEQGEYTHDRVIKFETEHGRGSGNFYRTRLVGSVENGAGFNEVLFLDHGEGPVAYAVGLYENQAAFERMDGVKIEWFNQSPDPLAESE